MRYEEARDLIETGDTINVLGRSGFLAALIRLLPGRNYTHSGMAYWFGDVLWLFELNGGHNHLIPLSQLEGEDFDVFARPPELSVAAVERAIIANLRRKIAYGVGALPVIGLLNLLRVKMFIHWRKILVCSGLIVKTLCDAGWPEATFVLSPDDLGRKLKLKLSVRRFPAS